MKNLKQNNLPEEVVIKKSFNGYKEKRSEWGRLRAIRFIYITIILFLGIGCISGVFGFFSGEVNYIPLVLAFMFLFFFINSFNNISKKMKLFEQEVKAEKSFKKEQRIIIRTILFSILFILIVLVLFF